MYSIEISLKDQDALPLLGTPRKALNPRKILPPPKGRLGSVTKRKQWIARNPDRSLNQALISGEIEPVNLQEWKRLHWGTLSTSDEVVEDGKILLKSEGPMDPLLEHIVENYDSVQAALVLGDEEVRIIFPDGNAEGIGEVLEEDLAGLGFEESLQCRLRSDLHFEKDWQQEIRKGRAVHAWAPWGRILIQSEDAWRPSAPFLIQYSNVLDDVLVVRHEGMLVLFDPVS